MLEYYSDVESQESFKVEVAPKEVIVPKKVEVPREVEETDFEIKTDNSRKTQLSNQIGWGILIIIIVIGVIILFVYLGNAGIIPSFGIFGGDKDNMITVQKLNKVFSGKLSDIIQKINNADFFNFINHKYREDIELKNSLSSYISNLIDKEYGKILEKKHRINYDCYLIAGSTAKIKCQLVFTLSPRDLTFWKSRTGDIIGGDDLFDLKIVEIRAEK